MHTRGPDCGVSPAASSVTPSAGISRASASTTGTILTSPCPALCLYRMYPLRAPGPGPVPSMARLSVPLLPRAVMMLSLIDTLASLVLPCVCLYPGAPSPPTDPAATPSSTRNDGPQKLLTAAGGRNSDSAYWNGAPFFLLSALAGPSLQSGLLGRTGAPPGATCPASFCACVIFRRDFRPGPAWLGQHARTPRTRAAPAVCPGAGLNSNAVSGLCWRAHPII